MALKERKARGMKRNFMACAFAVAILAGCGSVDENDVYTPEELSRLENYKLVKVVHAEEVRVDPEGITDTRHQKRLKSFDVFFRNTIHMVPKPLAGKGRLRKPPQPVEDRRFIPVANRQFAARVQGPVQSSQQEIVPDRRSLLPFGQPLIEQFQQPQSLGNTQECRHTTRLKNN